MSVPVKLPAIFTKAETLTDNSVKLIFVTREIGGADTAVLFGMKGQELWLLLSSENVDISYVPTEQPTAGKKKNTPSQRLRFTLKAYWNSMGAPGEFEQWYSDYVDALVEKLNARIDGVGAKR